MTNKEILTVISDRLENMDAKIDRVDDKVGETAVKIAKLEENLRIQERKRFAFSVPVKVGLIITIVGSCITGIISLLMQVF